MRKTRIIFIVFLFLFIPFPFFAQEIEYPAIPGAPAITATSTFPAYVKYIFNFVVVISGFIALAVMVWGGILHLTSAGDPSQMSEARNKIFAGLLGLVILLSSYLILYTINPQLVGLTLQPVEPDSGIYLKNAAGKKVHVGDTKHKLSITGVTEIEFISPTSSLLAIYLYTGENLKGSEARRINPGAKVTIPSPFATPKSISFLWNRPGVYLCPVTTAETICPSRPIHAPASIPDLSKYDFDNKIRSIQMKPGPNLRYGAILFEKPSYVSEDACPSVYNLNIPDLGATTTGYTLSIIGRDKLSSIIVFTYEPGREISGEVIFYDQSACLPGARSIKVNILDLITGEPFSNHPYDGATWDKKVKSLKINGPGGVLLMTENKWAPPYKTGRCQFFTPKDTDETRCIKNLPREIFHPVRTDKRPAGYLIVPYFH